MSDIHWNKTVTARKEHKCDQCYQEIPKGFEYVSTSGIFEGDFYSGKYHEECYSLWCRLNEDGDDYYYHDIMEILDTQEWTEFKAQVKKRYTPEMFYVGYREVFERPNRNGYTTNKDEAGKFTLKEARSMTEYTCAHGKARWFIACSALDGFVNNKLHPSEIY